MAAGAARLRARANAVVIAALNQDGGPLALEADAGASSSTSSARPGGYATQLGCSSTPRNKTKSFSLGGILLGDTMIYDPYPLCLCGDCEEEIQSLLSHQTLRAWDDFVQTNFDCPPEYYRDLPTKRRPALP